MKNENVERLFHGSLVEFEKFDPLMVGDRLTSLGLGHYLTPDPEMASTYGKFVTEFNVDTSNILDWQNLTLKQRGDIEHSLLEVIPSGRIAGFGEKKFEVIKDNKEGLKRLEEIEAKTKYNYHDIAKARSLTEDEIIKNHPGLLEQIGQDDEVIEWMEAVNLAGASDQTLMMLMNQYRSELAKELGFDGSRFSDQVAIYNPALATKIRTIEVNRNILKSTIIGNDFSATNNFVARFTEQEHDMEI